MVFCPQVSEERAVVEARVKMAFWPDPVKTRNYAKEGKPAVGPSSLSAALPSWSPPNQPCVRQAAGALWLRTCAELCGLVRPGAQG